MSMLTCPACGAETPAGPSTCPQCGAKLRGAVSVAARGDGGMLTALLVVAALCAGAGSLLLASPATLGAVVMGGAVLLAVLARMAQAAAFERHR